MDTFKQAGKTAAFAHYSLGALAGGTVAIALQMLLDKDLRTELLAGVRGIGRGVHPQVIRDAATLAPLLKHLDPKKARIAIGAVPGTGKSELAQVLAGRLGMQHHDADYSLGLSSIPRGSVAERYDMLANEDPEQFDALLHLKRPGASRGNATNRVLDIPALMQANQSQFNAAQGRASHPTDTAWLKLKPPGGFGTKNLDQPFVHKAQTAAMLAPGLLGMVGGAIAAHLLKTGSLERTASGTVRTWVGL